MKTQNLVITKITEVELKNILSEINSPTFVGIRTITPVKMNQYLNYWLFDENGKKSKNPNPIRNPFFDNGIFNDSKKYKIVTGFDYEKNVNSRLTKEGKDSNFESQDNWFDVISKGLVTDKKTGTKFYFRYQYQLDSTLEQNFSFEGNTIDKIVFQQFITEKSNYENQGLDNPLRFQVVDLKNIVTINLNGNKYEIIH
jgi:hypothetical protein